MKYRAERKGVGGTVTGFYFQTPGKNFITGGVYCHKTRCGANEYVLAPAYEIDPHTLAMSTGIKDKNKKEIFGSFEVDGVMSKGGDWLATSNSDMKYDLWSVKDYGYTQVTWSEHGWVGTEWTWDDADNDESVYSLRFIEIIPKGGE